MARAARHPARRRSDRRHRCSVCDCPDVRWLTSKEFTSVFPIELRTAYRLLAEGRLPGHKIGGTWFIDHDALDKRLLQERQAWA